MALGVLLGLVLGCAGAGPDDAGSIPKVYDGALLVTPRPVDLPGVVAGCVRSVELVFWNTSENLPVVITNVESPNPSLQLAESLPVALAPGVSRRLALHFTPSSVGRRAGNLIVHTDEGRLRPLEIPVRANAVARPAPAVGAAPHAPLDLVLVLDVSTTMSELGRLREALVRTFAAVEASGLDVRFGLTTFENDVLVHADGRFLEPEALLAELDSQLVEGSWVPDGDLPRHLLNFDLEENVLDALGRSAAEFPFRPEVRRFFLLMTDNAFLEPPATFSDGTAVRHPLADVARKLARAQIRLYSIHAPLQGRGLSSGMNGLPSLVESTRGAWFQISDVSAGTLALDGLLSDLIAGRTCPPL